jgi:hypothetical protein
MDITNSAVHRVINTTGLIELILLDDNIRMYQLFVLQHVSKMLKTVIVGSQKLQIKMFGTLAHSSKDANPGREENISRLLKDGGSMLFNPLMGVPFTNIHMELPIFRHFGFELERNEGNELHKLSLVSRHPLAGAVEKKLKSHLGGSWEGLKISCIPLTLDFRYGNTKAPELSLNGGDAVLRDLVNKLNTWYTYMRHQPREMTNATLVADLHFH